MRGWGARSTFSLSNSCLASEYQVTAESGSKPLRLAISSKSLLAFLPSGDVQYPWGFALNSRDLSDTTEQNKSAKRRCRMRYAYHLTRFVAFGTQSHTRSPPSWRQTACEWRMDSLGCHALRSCRTRMSPRPPLSVADSDQYHLALLRRCCHCAWSKEERKENTKTEGIMLVNMMIIIFKINIQFQSDLVFLNSDYKRFWIRTHCLFAC